MRRLGWWAATTALVVLGGVATAATKPAPKPAGGARPAAAASQGGTVNYWMGAATTSGMTGGGQPDMAAMMSGRYNPNAANHTLLLQLGSPRRPQGEPNAEHIPPRDLGAGPSLPLLTPTPHPVQTTQTPYERPQGRMLIFWGCGEHAGPNQPVVIDFAKLGQSAGAQQMAAANAAFANLASQGPVASRYATFGEWPNERTRGGVPAGGSLTGDHLVRGNYTPDINFSLTPNQDFLPPFVLTTNVKTPSGAANLGWRRVDGAAAYFANMIGAQGGGRGGGGDNTVVIWTSSQIQASGFGLPEYLSTGDINRLLANHVLMPPTTLACTIPQEAVRAVGETAMFNLVAYGDETDFAYPPRPADPKAAWSPQWTVKVRYRSATGGMVGMDMAAMMRGDAGDGDDDGRRPPQQQQRPRKPGGLLGGLGGILP